MTVISYLTTIEFEVGAFATLGDHLAGIGIKRPFVVTDLGVVEAGILDRLPRSVGAIPAESTFTETPANPTETAGRRATERYLASGCDGILAIGGGSPVDLAKAVALMATHPDELRQYAATLGGAGRITARTAPVVAVPTTAGTGSEVGRATLIITADGRKRAIISPYLLPRLALCDPDLTLGLPAPMTAGTGMDAIAHCLETLLSPRINPPAEAIALDGLARGFASIGRACDNGNDRGARWEMMMASLQGGLAFQKGLGAVHALSHALGALPGPRLHHGTLNAVLIPAVLDFVAGHIGDKGRRITAALGLPQAADLSRAFRGLADSIGLPAGLAEMGVSRGVLPRMAEEATEDFSHQTSPRRASVADYVAILEASF